MDTLTTFVELGRTGERSLAATVFGLLDRGARLRPALAAELQGCVLVTFAGGEHADVRVSCAGGRIQVADDALAEPPPPARRADLEIHASLHDFVVLVGAPLSRGFPRPTDRQGRAALARIADGRVDFIGSIGLARRFMRLMSVAPER
jgi:hypothetical protein